MAGIAAVESARYALMRRLGYVFRHHLVVNLQPLSMTCQVMRYRLNGVPIDVSPLHESVDQVERLVRSSIESCSEVISWIAAKGEAGVSLGEALGECLANIRSSFSFRGFVIRYEDPHITSPVSQVALREVLTAALITVADHAQGLNEIVVTVVDEAKVVDITLQVQSGTGASVGEQNAYRLLTWGDVQSLADFHALQLVHQDTGKVRIRLPHTS
ncbi:MAG: hypothetical protein V4627_19070 [Pseudomonadota bacterium]